MPTPRQLDVRTVFRTAALVEAATWVGLLVGMAFKYVISGNEAGVHLFGPLHGGAFIAYVLMTVVAARAYGWRLQTIVLALAASIPPFATWAFEAWADRTGRLSRVGVGR
jgi:integral membrane protein